MSRSSSQPTVESGLPSLVPHGRFKGKPAMPLGRPLTTIGARSRSHIHLLSSSVSKSHAIVVNNGTGFYVRDLASRTHVLINGQQVREAELKDGDIIAVGPFTFRFSDPVRRSKRPQMPAKPPAGVLRVTGQPLPLSLESRVTVIGRRPNCDIVLDEIEVSTTHAVVFEMEGKRYVRDLGSRTGTFVNGTPIHQQAIEFGDSIKIGDTDMSYVAAADLETGAEAHDDLEDLVGTAPLAPEEPIELVFDDEPAAPSFEARPAPIPMPDLSDLHAAPAVPAPAEEFDLDLSLEPALESDATSEAPAAAAPSLDDLAIPSLKGELPGELPKAATPQVSEPSAESALGIELLPHDEEVSAEAPFVPAAPSAKSPAANEADFGLEFADDAKPAAELPAEAEAEAELTPAPRDEVQFEVPGVPALADTAAPLEPAPLDLSDVEVIDKTEPTPESALDVESALPTGAAGVDTWTPETAAASDAMTDSVFGREVEAFEGPGLGPIVEPPAPAAEAPAPIAEALTPEKTSDLDDELDLLLAGKDEAVGATDIDDLIFDDVSAPAAAEAPAESAPASAAPEIALIESKGIEDAPLEAVGVEADLVAEAPAAPAEPAIEPVDQASAEADVAEAEVVAETAASDAVIEAPDTKTPAKKRGGRKAAAPKAAKPKAAAKPKRKGSRKQSAADVAVVPTDLPAVETPAESEAVAEAPTEPVADVASSVAPIVVPPTEVSEIETADELALSAPAPAETAAEPEIEPAASEAAPLDLAAEEPAAELPPIDEAAVEVETAPSAEFPADLAPEIPAEEAKPVAEAAIEEPAIAPTFAPVVDETVAVDKVAIDEAAVDEVAVTETAELPETPAELSPAVASDVLRPMTDDEGRSIDVELGTFDISPEPTPAEATSRATLDRVDEPAFAPESSAAAELSAPAIDLASPDLASPIDLADDLMLPADEAPADASAAASAPSDDLADELVFEDVAPQDVTPEVTEGSPAPASEIEPSLTVDLSASPETVEPTPPAKPADLFFGLERDTASFLGGMPLQLPPLQGGFTPPPPRVTFAAPEPRAPEPDVEAYHADPEPDEPELLPELSGDYGDIEAPSDDIVAAPPAAPGATRPKQPTPPPPARFPSRDRKPGGRSAPSSPFDLGLEDAQADRVDIPSFAGPGPATRGQVTTAFDGLAMPPVRETDVFSQKPLGDTLIPPFAGASGQTPTIPSSASDDDFEDDEPLDLTSVDDDGVTPAADDAAEAAILATGPAEVAPSAPEARKLRPAASPQRRPPSYPAEPAGGRPAPKKKRFRFGKWGLFGLMLICMATASAGIWFLTPKFFPSTAQISAWIKFDKLDKLTEAQRQAVLVDQKRKLGKMEVRASAREILQQNQGGLAPGFLAETGSPDEVKAAAVAYTTLADSLRLVEKKPAIQVDHDALDGDADRKRVQALLTALYAENKPMVDAAGRLSRQFEEKKQELQMQTRRRNEDVLPAVEAARQELGGQNVIEEKRAIVEALQKKDRDLSAAWDSTSKRVKAMTSDLREAESIVPFDPDAEQDAPTAPSIADDAEVAVMTQRVEELNASIAARKQKSAAQADEARKAMAAALKQFEDDIAAARGSMTPNSELGTYLDAAARMQSRLKVVSGELAQQQRSDMERLTMLKRKLAEKNEARIRQAFAGDPDLQALQESLALKERQLNTAIGSGLRDDARALEKEVKGLKLEIESRQDLLTTADGIAPDMKELEDFITDMLARMEKDRTRNDQQMAEMLTELAAQAPAAGSLPAEQKAFAEKLEKRQAELNKAREQFTAAADAAAVEADAEVKKLEAELASATAKAEERKNQLAVSARKTLSEEQQKVRVAMTASRQRELDRAIEADENAATAFFANRQSLNNAKAELEAAGRRTEGYEQANRKSIALQANIQALDGEVEKLRQQVEASVVPVQPMSEDIVVALDKPDMRKVYILAADLGLGLIFFFLVLFAPAHPERLDEEMLDIDAFPDGDAVPFAAPLPRDPDMPSMDAATVMEEATARVHQREEAPAGV